MPDSLLPPNATQLELDIEEIIASNLIGLPEAIANLYAIDECPSEHLPFLAWAVSVDVWRDYWPDDVKRNYIRQSFAVHKTKGTLASLEAALDALNITTQITEWFQDNGERFTFRVRALAGRNLRPDGDALIDQELITTIKCVVEAIKPLRSRFALEIGASPRTTLTPVMHGAGANIALADACIGQKPTRPTLPLVPVSRIAAAAFSRADISFGGIG